MVGHAEVYPAQRIRERPVLEVTGLELGLGPGSAERAGYYSLSREGRDHGRDRVVPALRGTEHRHPAVLWVVWQLSCAIVSGLR